MSPSENLILMLQLTTLVFVMLGIGIATAVAMRILSLLTDLRELLANRNYADALEAMRHGRHDTAHVLANGDAARLRRFESLQHQIEQVQSNLNAIEESISQFASPAEVPTQLYKDKETAIAELRRLIREIRSA